MPGHHLAQMNLATLRHRPDDPRMVGFKLGAHRIVRAAATAPGHVWNEQFAQEETARLITRSVWESFDALRDFVYSGVHAAYLKRTAEWFLPATAPGLALWWVPAGEIPTVEDALARLETLRAHGPTPEAFDFAHPHAAAGA